MGSALVDVGMGERMGNETAWKSFLLMCSTSSSSLSLGKRYGALTIHSGQAENKTKPDKNKTKIGNRSLTLGSGKERDGMGVLEHTDAGRPPWGGAASCV